MSIRNKAIQWYEAEYGKPTEPLYTSKLYQPHESWTNTTVWWVEIPINIIQDNTKNLIHLLCQKESGHADFYHLRIPSEFFLKNINSLEVNNGRFSLFLSADLGSFFIEKRGPKNLDFSSFLQ